MGGGSSKNAASSNAKQAHSQAVEIKNDLFLNIVIQRLWKHLDMTLGNVVEEVLIPKMRHDLKAARIGLLKITSTSLGTKPVHIAGISVYPEEDGCIKLDIKIRYDGDACAEGKLAGLPFGVRDLKVNGCVRVLLGPVGGLSPIGSMSFFLLERPELDYDLTGLANIGDLIGIRCAIRKVIFNALDKFIIYPNRRVVFIDKDLTDKQRRELKHPHPTGNLVVSDITVTGISSSGLFSADDVFVHVSVYQDRQKTKAVTAAKTMQFDDTLEFPLLAFEGTVVKFEVYNRDWLRSNGLGRAQVNLSSLDDDCMGGKMTTLKMTHPSGGSVKCKLLWTPVQVDSSAVLTQAVGSGADVKGGATASGDDQCSLLVVSIADLSGTPHESGTSYSAEVQLGGVVKDSLNAVQTSDGLFEFEDVFHFCCHSAKTDSLQIKILGRGSDDRRADDEQLGSTTIPVRTVTKDGTRNEQGNYALSRTVKINDANVKVTVHLQLMLLKTRCDRAAVKV